ncbi:hypothetical protein JCM6882_004243 [Rhodosporidiobolus microsporus]
MQGLLSAVVGPSPLSLANLSTHTKQEGLAPRRTVRLYLDDQRRTAGQYDLRPPPSDEFDALDPAAFPVVEVAPPPPVEEGRKRWAVNEASGADTALVLHAPDEDGAAERAHRGAGREVTRSRSKPSLVQAMRPRLSSAPTHSSPAAPTKRQDAVKLVAAEEANAAAGPSRSSSILVARVEQKAAAKAARSSPVKRALEVDDEEEQNRDRKGKAKAKEDEPVKPSKSAIAKKGKLRAEVEDDDEQKEEVEERLRARRERRASKALIRKDCTQTAASVGTAAALKVKKAAKAKKRAAEASGDEAGSAASSPKKVKKKRTSAERESRSKVQELERPSGIGTARLTLKPPKQLGIFNKGKASARTKIGQPLPDLAFSELNFLNSTRRSPPLSPSASSPSSASDENLPAPPSLLRPTTLPRMYGSKTKTRRTSSKHFPAFEHDREQDEDEDALPPPLKKKARLAAPEGKKPKEKKKAPKFRTVFSHVEIPVRRSSSSASASLPRSPSKPKPKAGAKPARPLTATTTNESALSAASLARRRRSAPTAAPGLVELEALPEPTLRRRADPEGEQSAPSFGGGFDANPAAQDDPLPSAAGESQSLRSSELQRMIDGAGLPSSGRDGKGEQDARGPFSPLRGDTFSPHLGRPSFVGTATDGDGFIHLRPPRPAAAEENEGEVSFANVTAASYLPYAPGGSGVTPFLESYAAAHSDDLGDGDAKIESFQPAAPLPSAAAFPAAFSDAPSVFPSISGSFTAPSALAPLPGVADYDHHRAQQQQQQPTFLRSSLATAAATVGAPDLEDEAAWREAMRRQWPRTRC